MSLTEKMDMSLDEIIRLQASKKSGKGRSGSFRLKNGVGKSAGFKNHHTFATPAGQRVAQNLVKRAMIGQRKQAIFKRGHNPRMATVMDTQLGNNRAQRFVYSMRKWQKTAHVFQNVLQWQENRPRRRRTVGLRREKVARVLPTRLGISQSLQSRLGWKNNSPNTFQNNLIRQPTNFRTGRGRRNNTFGQMQNDIVSREQARGERLITNLLSKTINRSIRNSRKRGALSSDFNNRRFNNGIRNNFNGRGRNVSYGNRNRFNFSNQSFLENSSTNGPTITLNERFGGGKNGFNSYVTNQESRRGRNQRYRS